MRRLALVLTMLIACAAVFIPRTLAQGTLDQSNTAPQTSSAAIFQNTPTVLAQSFTAGISGSLDSVALALSASSPGATATVGVYATTGAVPNAMPTGAVTVQPTTPPTGAAQYTTVTFAAPAPVVAGQVYALVLGPVLTPALGGIFGIVSISDPYAGGNFAFSPSGSGGPFNPLPTFDADFQTFVTPPVPAPAPVISVTNPPVTLGITIKGHGSLTPPAFTLVNQLQAIPVRAVPDPGSVFVGWTAGPCNGTAINPCDIAPTGSTTITATFAPYGRTGVPRTIAEGRQRCRPSFRVLWQAQGAPRYSTGSGGGG